MIAAWGTEGAMAGGSVWRRRVMDIATSLSPIRPRLWASQISVRTLDEETARSSGHYTVARLMRDSS